MSGYAIDSNGNAVAINNAKQIQMVQPLENRRKELVKYVYQLTPLLQSAGLNVNTNQFTLLFSPNGILEKFVLFAKIPLQSNSPLVKQAFEASTHYDYPFQSNQQKAFLKSIYCIQVNYKPTWWYVSAEVITLERNIIDGIWISAKKEASIPYYAFQSKYQLKSVEQPIQSPQTFWCISLTGESLPDNVNDLFPLMAQIPSKSTILADAVSKVNQNIGISAKDSNSNQISSCLRLINSPLNGKIYPVYKELKQFISRTYPYADDEHGAFNISYKDDAIRFQLQDGRKAEIFVKGNALSPTFVSGGYTVKGISAMEEAIANGNCFRKTTWFDTKASPYILRKSRKENKPK